jgi:hypothetical protein
MTECDVSYCMREAVYRVNITGLKRDDLPWIHLCYEHLLNMLNDLNLGVKPSSVNILEREKATQ